MFGEPLGGVGFGLYPHNVPMLKRCLEAKSTDELDRHWREKLPRPCDSLTPLLAASMTNAGETP